jgi:hypothetical protein
VTLEELNADVAALTEEIGARGALERYGFDLDDATTFGLVAGGSAGGATLILHGLMVGAAHMEQLQLAKEMDS